MISKELIEKFFRNECSREEQQQVLAYFIANPEEFAEHLDQEEIEGFEPVEIMENTLSKSMFEKVKQQTTKKTRTIRMLQRISVAASVILVLGFGWIYFAGSKKTQSVAKVEEKAKKEEEAVKMIDRHEVNQTGKEKTLNLEDGSVVVLANNSEISYHLPFVDSRNITLVGKGFFKVQKDVSKPFSVISGEIATTALGTEFTVSTFKGSSRVVIRLYEGKVVIKGADKVKNKLKKNVYLSPGQEFVYGNQKLSNVHSFNMNNTNEYDHFGPEQQFNDNPSIPENTKGTWFQFNNRPIDEVFDQLAQIYNVKIIYNKKDVQNLYFIGKYNSSDSVDAILKRIGILNNLTVTRNNSAFTISK